MSDYYDQLGRLVQRYETNFPSGTLPSWLPSQEEANFSLSMYYPPSNTPGGGIVLHTGGIASSSTGFQSPIYVDMTKVVMAEVQLIVSGGGGSTVSASLGFKNADASRVGGVVRRANNSTSYLRSFQADGTEVLKDTTHRSWVGNDIRHKIGYRIFPNETDAAGNPVRMCSILMDGTIFDEQTFTDTEFPLDSPVMYPFVTFSNSSTAVQIATRTVHQFSFTAVYL